MEPSEKIDGDGVVTEGAARTAVAGNINGLAQNPASILRNWPAFFGSLGNGAFMGKVHDGLESLNADLNKHIDEGNKKAKGKLTIEVEFELERGVCDINSSFKIKGPAKADIDRTVLWITADGKFSSEHPRQMTLFPPK